MSGVEVTAQHHTGIARLQSSRRLVSSFSRVSVLLVEWPRATRVPQAAEALARLLENTLAVPLTFYKYSRSQS